MAQIPIDLELRKASDSGKPLVTEEDSRTKDIFKDLALKLEEILSENTTSSGISIVN